MPLTVENCPELLNEEMNMATQKTQRVRVIRPFYEKGEIRGVDSVVDQPVSVALELRQASKVAFVQSDTKIKQTTDVPQPIDGSLPARKADKAA